MLSPQTLERVSSSYRKGYYDGYDGRSRGANYDRPETYKGVDLKPFAARDYDAGYKAGANDAYWAARRAR